MFFANLLNEVKIDQQTLDKLWNVEWGALWPAWIVTGGMLLVLLSDIVLPKSQRNALAWLSAGVLAAAIASAFFLMDNKPVAFQGMISSDNMSRFMAALIFGSGIAAIMLSPDYFSRIGAEIRSEYYALVLATTAGMWLLSVSLNFMVFFIALETFSLSLYILAGFLPRSVRSHEAGFKYFLLSSFATAFMLYGMALLFGVTKSTSYGNIFNYIQANKVAGDQGILVLIAVAMLVVGFAFKMSAVPFHMWTPDVYEGAPTPITALMAVGTKAAIVAAFIRLFSEALGPIHDQWQPIIYALAIITMLAGAFLAATQQNVKRLLAYSSVNQAGYLLIGLTVDNPLGNQGLMFYILSYTVMTLGAFAVIVAVEGPRGEGRDIHYFTGLAKTHPYLAATMAVCLLSLGGIPPTVGFFGKALVFGAAIQEGGWYLALALVGVISSVIAVFYYFRVIIQMYMNGEPTHKQVTGRPALAVIIVLLVTGVGTMALGILSGVAFDWAQQAAGIIVLR